MKFKDESFPLRGTTLFHPCLTTGALWSTVILLRVHGRSRRSLYLAVVGAPLQDHVHQSLPYPFPPYRALCAVSQWLLFSSLRLKGIIQFPFGLQLVYATLPVPSSRYFAQKSWDPRPAAGPSCVLLIGNRTSPPGWISASFSGPPRGCACPSAQRPGCRWTGRSAPGSPAPPRTPTG